MSWFLSFPREIRDDIYSLVLCVDGVIAPYVHTREPDSCCTPLYLTALLLANKQIREECLSIWLGNNIWHVSADCDHDEFFENYGSLFRKIFIDYHFREENTIGRSALKELCCTLQLVPNVSYRTEILHVQKLLFLFDCWQVKNRYVEHMTRLTNVTISIQKLYCPIGCCRYELLKELLNSNLLRASDVLAQNPLIEFVGAKNKAEDLLIEQWVCKRNSIIQKQRTQHNS
jgi:hypothetical protein